MTCTTLPGTGAWPSKVNWRGVDWTKRDIDISRTLRVSRERVRQVRKSIGAAQSPNHKRLSPDWSRRLEMLRQFMEQEPLAKYLPAYRL